MAIYQNKPAVVTRADGTAVEVTLIENPLIDDVLIAEAKVQAYLTYTGSDPEPGRRVDRNLRDFLIRLGVSR